MLNLSFLSRILKKTATLFALVFDLASCIISFSISFGSSSCIYMNYNIRWWFFLCRFFIMVHICNFCPKKVFHNNVFLMFHRFGDNSTIYVLYGEISENYRCRRFRFWRGKFCDNDLGLDTILILRLICRATDRIFLFIILVFCFIYFFLF